MKLLPQYQPLVEMFVDIKRIIRNRQVEGQTIEWPKEKGQTMVYMYNTTQKTTYQATRTPQKNGSKIMYSRVINCICLQVATSCAWFNFNKSYSNKAMLLLDWSHCYNTYTVVITNSYWFTVTKYPFLQWQCIFFVLLSPTKLSNGLWVARWLSYICIRNSNCLPFVST
jgi:hypothetical protein